MQTLGGGCHILALAVPAIYTTHAIVVSSARLSPISIPPVCNVNLLIFEMFLRNGKNHFLISGANASDSIKWLTEYTK